MYAAIYDRVSKDNRSKKSIGEQEAENRVACDENKWTVREVYVDNDLSASRFARKERPDWARLIEDLGRRTFDVLVMWESSRGGRELEMWAHLLTTCRDRGVLIHITTHDHTYDLQNLRDWKALADDGVGSQYEAELTSTRIRRNVRANAMKGRPHGRLLYGYRREYHPDSGVYVRTLVDERVRLTRPAVNVALIIGLFQWAKTDVRVLSVPLAAAVAARQIDSDDYLGSYTAAAVVREMVGRIAAGESCRAISQSLNDRGIPTPQRNARGWQQEQVSQQASNPGYIARRTHHGEVVGDADWPALVDEATYHAAMARLSDPSRRTARDNAIKHLLSGIALCGVCGTPVRRLINRRKYESYVCVYKNPRTNRGYHVGRKIQMLDEYVERVLFERLARPDNEWMARDSDAAEELTTAMDAVATLRARLNEWYDAAAAGAVKPAGLARIEAQMLPQIEAAEARLKTVRLPTVLHDLPSKVDDIEGWWGGLSMPQRRDVIRGLMRVWIMPAGRRKLPVSETVRIEWLDHG